MLEATSRPLDRAMMEIADSWAHQLSANLPHVLIERYGSITSHGTFGQITATVGGRVIFSGYTAERPWLGNARNISCIPPGVYTAERDTHYGQPGEEDDYEVWELQGVPERDQIQLHIANYPRQVKGCIAVGKSILIITEWEGDEPELGVTDSRRTFAKLMEATKDYNKIIVEIKWRDYNESTQRTRRSF